MDVFIWDGNGRFHHTPPPSSTPAKPTAIPIVTAVFHQPPSSKTKTHGICYNNRMIAEAKDLTTIRQQLNDCLPDIGERYSVSYLGIFGSYVRDEATPESDLDVLVDFSTPPTLFQFVRLKNELSDLLGISVDLVMKSALKPKIGAHVLAEVVPV